MKKKKKTKTKKLEAIAVLISDVHYNINTLALADRAMNLAIDKANELNVRLIVAGDLNDTKANIRAECANAMLKTFPRCILRPMIIVGNHDRINEKAKAHSLNFLSNCADLIDCLTVDPVSSVALIPYHHDVSECKRDIANAGARIIIMHQGVGGSFSGEYMQDKSALNKEDLSGLRIISGHYHRRQTIELPEGGKFDYLGNPYTLNYAEAEDPPKGFHILYNDGSLELVSTNLRKHVVLKVEAKALHHYVCENYQIINPGDLAAVKLSGPKELLALADKTRLSEIFGIDGPYRLDLVPIETNTTKDEERPEDLTQGEILDSLIASLTNVSEEQKARLKLSWKDFV